MDQSKFFVIIGPLAFRAADKFFKFVSWAIILSVLGYAFDVTKSTPLRWVQFLGTMSFAGALFMQAIYMFVRDPSDWKIPPEYHAASRTVQFVLGCFLLFVCSAPFVFLDTIIADLQASKLHEAVLHPQ
ncbi:MAG: hypothetical protein AAGD15_09715 [Agrobacterium cavarae]|uniref:hypothetical protein n=1 Tax=Agrobacterium cavarae TaxID=2528239 RepID=UPI0031A58A51